MRATVPFACFSVVSCLRSGARSRPRCGVKGAGAEGAEDLQRQIVGGVDADECEWKWQVGLLPPSRKAPYCGGTLISEDWALTAAHCVDDPARQVGLRVVAGQHRISLDTGNEQYRDVSKVVLHPEWNRTDVSHDFALLQLSSPMNFNSCVGAACLPRDSDLQGGETCWITGFGTLFTGSKQGAEVLQEVSVKTLSTEMCRTSGYGSFIKDHQVCAQGFNARGDITDACKGDSGGPMVCSTGNSWTLYGVTSFGFGCADPLFPGVYGRVHEVISWIDQQLV